MQKAYLSKLGITANKPIHHNLSYEELYKHETDSLLIDYERGIDTELGAVNVDTGRFTGRSASDKYFVVDDITENMIWWHGPEITGSGNRIALSITLKIINTILDGSIEECTFTNMPLFNLAIPTTLGDLDANVLDPRASWQDKSTFDKQAKKLAKMFIENFKHYTQNEAGKALIAAGPQ